LVLYIDLENIDEPPEAYTIVKRLKASSFISRPSGL